jgi:hypothetical protein
MITFYIVRNPMALYGGTYALASYVPKKNSHGTPCWWFYSNDPSDFTAHLHSEDLEKVVKKLGKEVEPGTCVNLTTGEITRLEDAVELFPENSK